MKKTEKEKAETQKQREERYKDNYGLTENFSARVTKAEKVALNYLYQFLKSFR